jgi:catechol 2,3-dioxygenase-like lactoylglutathione lyase family enzyme
MPLTAFDHVNLRTARLPEMLDWYTDVLGLEPGPRPDFDFDGAWLYLGETAVVHLVAVAEPGRSDPPLALEHFAFRARDLPGFLARLDARGDAYRLVEIADVGLLQVNVHDPDGNHIHVDFPLAERAKQG